MRNQTLAELVTMFRLECGISTQIAQGVQQAEFIKQMIRRQQETLFADFDWPFLHVYRTEEIRRNENLYSWPDDIVSDDVRQFWDFAGNTYTPAAYGIGMGDRNAYGVNVLADPILRWQMVGDRQYEVWPTPATDRKAVMECYLSLRPMVADGDRCTLDGTMLVLFAAAEWLARNKVPDAPAKQQAAQQLSRNLRKRSVSDKRRRMFPLLPGPGGAAYLGRYRSVASLPPPIPR